MPPVKQRTRSYDPARTRAAVLTQFGHVCEGVRGLSPAQLALPTRLGAWMVADLTAHIALTVASVSRALERDEPEKPELTARDYPFVTATHADAVAEGARDLAQAAPDLAALCARTEEELTGHLAAVPAGRLITTRAGAVSLTDHLVTCTVELVVHTDDLNAAVAGLDLPIERQALAACTRLLADALAVKAPGGSTEVRIPPYAVVQCVAGPRHTRGTPPNVVETDPLTWVRLASGRLDWATALDGAKLSASGERADLSGLLPVMS